MPRPARNATATRLSEILDIVVKENSLEAWERLFLFGRRCLHAPVRGGHRRNLASSVIKAVNEEKDPAPSESVPFKPVKDPLKNLATRVAAKLEEGDFRGAVRIASSNEVFAPNNESTLNLLSQKHPSQHPMSSMPPESVSHSCNSVEVTAFEVINSIQSFPARSAGGPDGLRPQHLKDLISGRSGAGSGLLIQSLTSFVNFVANGGMLASARPYFFGATLVALSKPDGGVRPIAVGCTLRRLVAKCASHAVRDAMAALLAPLQLGYGTSMGSEAAVHAARTYLHSMPDDHLLLKLDFSNAFNSIRRDKMLHACLDYAPDIYPPVHSAYAKPTHLFLGNNIMNSSEGVQQGDPLGPLLFCLAIHPMLTHLKSDFKVFYLDDGTLGGSCDEVMQDLESLGVVANDLGLVLNHSKTEIVCADSRTVSIFQSFSTRFRRVEPCDACLLGSPIGDLASIDHVLGLKHDALKLMGERLSLLHSQDALLLLRNAFRIRLFISGRVYFCF